jgi:hypothetical protein
MIESEHYESYILAIPMWPKWPKGPKVISLFGPFNLNGLR